MILTRRKLLAALGLGVAAGTAIPVARKLEAATKEAVPPSEPQQPPPARVVTPDGAALPWTMKDGAKEFRLVAGEFEQEFAPGMRVKCWGYNGRTPGPTIEAVEGDRVRILVENRLPEGTAVHWHGLFVPNGMDGVAGLTQPAIEPGKTGVYEFTLRQHGTFMYHPHSDEMTQMALGMMGFFVVHPRGAGNGPRADRDYAIFLAEWAIDPGTFRPRPSVMTDFNTFTFNGRVFPGTAPLLAQKGERVRIRIANVSMDNHPIHLHGHAFHVTATDGGPVPESARWPETTVDVPPGTTRTIEFVADNPGDWPLHCHKSHHAMNAMNHDVPNLVGVDQERSGVAKRIAKLVPGYMPMGGSGMDDMASMGMRIPKNTLPMMAGDGPYGPVGMGGMFTVLKVRDTLPGDGSDPGWYRPPVGTAFRQIDSAG